MTTKKHWVLSSAFNEVLRTDHWGPTYYDADCNTYSLLNANPITWEKSLKKTNKKTWKACFLPQHEMSEKVVSEALIKLAILTKRAIRVKKIKAATIKNAKIILISNDLPNYIPNHPNVKSVDGLPKNVMLIFYEYPEFFGLLSFCMNMDSKSAGLSIYDSSKFKAIELDSGFKGKS